MNVYLEHKLAKHAQLCADADAITAQAAEERRDVTSAEAATYRGMVEEAKAIEDEIAPMRELETRQANMNAARAELATRSAAARDAGAPPSGQLERYRAAGAGTWLADWATQRENPDAADRLRRAHAEYRVVADQKLADNPGIVPTPIVGGVVDTLNPLRPFINSVTNLPMPAGGATFNRPKITQQVTVGQQATEKTQLASQKMTIGSTPVSKKTFGGTLDISFQDRDWTDPAILQLVVNDLANVYAKQTDDSAADGLVAAATGTFVLGASPASGAVRAAVLNAANQIAVNVGQYPDRCWMAPDVAAQLGAIVETGSGGLPSFPGLSQVGSSGDLMGLTSVIDVNFAAGTMLIGCSSFVEHYEQVGGLLSVTEPTILGYTVAYYGYVADLLLDVGAVLKRSLT